MNAGRKLLKPILLAGSFIFAGALLAQTTPSVIINGKTSGADVRQIDGHWYIDVEALATSANGTYTIEPNRIELTIPSDAVAETTPPSSGAAPSTASASAPPEGLSRSFAGAAIATGAEMREWRGAIETMITYGLAVSAAWAQGYHDQSESSLMEAAVAATTDSDQQALQLLRNEFDVQSSWANDVITARQTLNGAQTVNPNALQDDPVLNKLRTCSSFLNGMLVSGMYADNAACH